MSTSRGFTLIESIVVLAILSVISVVCFGILTSALSAKNRSIAMANEHVSLRQALLTVTREIRKNPDEDISGRYLPVGGDGMLRRQDGSVVAKNIAENGFSIDTESDPGKAIIFIKSIHGREVTTIIHLRVDV